MLQDAYQRAQVLPDSRIRPVPSPDVVICSCEEYPIAWVFGFKARRFLVGLEITALLVGSGPVVDPKSGDALHFGTSGTQSQSSRTRGTPLSNYLIRRPGRSATGVGISVASFTVELNVCRWWPDQTGAGPVERV